MSTQTDKRASYFVTTPYIDAYEHDYEAFGFAQGKPQLTFDEFVKRMSTQGNSWGEMGIGRAILSGRDPAMTDGGDYILAIGRWDGYQYVALAGDTFPLTVIKQTWPHEWDVT